MQNPTHCQSTTHRCYGPRRQGHRSSLHSWQSRVACNMTSTDGGRVTGEASGVIPATHYVLQSARSRRSSAHDDVAAASSFLTETTRRARSSSHQQLLYGARVPFATARLIDENLFIGAARAGYCGLVGQSERARCALRRGYIISETREPRSNDSTSLSRRTKPQHQPDQLHLSIAPRLKTIRPSEGPTAPAHRLSRQRQLHHLPSMARDE